MAAFLLLVLFLLLPGLRLLLVFFFELRADLPVDFFPVFDLAFEADFFLVTFLRASFRLGFDLPALAAFFRLVFFLALFLLVFLLVFFLPAFFALVFFGVFRAAFFFLLVFFRLDAVAARLREVFFAVFFDPRFFGVAFLVGMRVDPGWFQMQPAIIHRRVGRGSPSGRHFETAAIQGRSTGRAGSKPGPRCSATTVV